MKKLTTLVFGSVLLLGSLNSSAIAQTEAPSFGPRIGLRYTTEGPGTDPFASVESFIPLFQNPGNNLTFLEGRLNVSTINNNPLGGNVILGHRFLSDDKKDIIGGYVSFDIRNTGNTVFNQLGTGIEVLGENFELRSNAYIPLGRANVLVSRNLTGTGFFQGGRLQLDRVNQFQEALPGFDIELGAKLLRLGEGSLRGYAGLYYYDGELNPSVVGVRGRLVARPTDYLSLALLVQTDSRFDTRAVVSLGLNFPGSAPRGVRKSSVLARMGEQVDRISSITVDKGFVRDSVTATFGNNNVRFVGFGNGSLTNVGDALNVAQNNEIIFVGTSTNSGLDLNSDRLNGVQLLGVSQNQTITTDQGNFLLQPLNPGVTPSIAGNVNLGTNNTLSGFAIAGTVNLAGNNNTLSNLNINANNAGRAISGVGINNVTIQNSTIANAVNEAIYLENVGGTVAIVNNTISNTTSTLGAGQDSFNGEIGAIVVNNDRGQVNLNISQNTITNTSDDAIEVSLAGTAQGTAQISNNTITNADYGIFVPLVDTAQGTVNISNNNISQVSQNGIFVRPEDNSKLSVAIADNTIANAINEGINIAVNTSVFPPFGSASVNANVVNNSITRTDNNGIAGFEARADKSGRLCLQVDRNTSIPGFSLRPNGEGVTFQVVDAPTLSARNNSGTFTVFGPGTVSNLTGSCPAP